MGVPFRAGQAFVLAVYKEILPESRQLAREDLGAGEVPRGPWDRAGRQVGLT